MHTQLPGRVAGDCSGIIFGIRSFVPFFNELEIVNHRVHGEHGEFGKRNAGAINNSASSVRSVVFSMNTTGMPRYKGGIGTDVKKASDIIKKNGIVVYPTETVYGIGANIFSEDALQKVFAIKKRDADKPVSVAVSDFKMMNELAHIGERERRFIEKFLPGPVTVLLKKKEKVPDALTSGSELVGIRFPDHETTIKLIELAGVPITSTSANISGEAPPKKVDEIKIPADYVIDGGGLKGEPSTVVDLVNRRIVRKGAKYEEVAAALKDY